MSNFRKVAQQELSRTRIGVKAALSPALSLTLSSLSPGVLKACCTFCVLLGDPFVWGLSVGTQHGSPLI